MTQKFTLDAIDHNIVEQLRRNGRATNQQIAEELGLTATTVSSRIRRMEDANQLRVVAVSDFAAHGYNFLMEVAIEVDGRPASVVAEELAQFPEVFAAHLVTGRYDIDILVALRDFSDLSALLFNKFSGVRGIRAMIPAIVVDIIKYQFDVAPIEASRQWQGPETPSSPHLNSLDQQLIELLSCDARVSNRKIAQELGVTEGTVRGRIKRLQQDGLMAFTAITGFGVAEKSRLAFISVQAEASDVRHIARQISEMSLINAVMITMGEFNILAMCLFEELDEMVEVASDHVLGLPGVHHVETSIAARTIRYNARVARITSRYAGDEPSTDDDA